LTIVYFAVNTAIVCWSKYSRGHF